ncbi:MAG: PGPGW domain-containing protein [Pseudolysinimonas sp.]
MKRNPKADKAYRAAVGVTGGATVALGVALIPLPGPGSLVALGGLAVLGTEFEGARKVNEKATAVAKKAAGKVAEVRAARKARP